MVKTLLAVTVILMIGFVVMGLSLHFARYKRRGGGSGCQAGSFGSCDLCPERENSSVARRDATAVTPASHRPCQ